MAKRSWPRYTGLMSDDGAVCVTSTKHRVTLYHPETLATRTCAFSSVPWASNRSNIALLAGMLMEIACLKSGEAWDRGTAAPQVVSGIHPSTTLFLYEAGARGAIFPRYLWTDVVFDVCGALCQAIGRELRVPKLTGQNDTRSCGLV